MAVSTCLLDDMSTEDGKYIVGAYATAPSLASDDRIQEQNFYNDLVLKLDSIRGLEIPFWGDDIHQFGSEFLLGLMQPSWKNVLSCIPGSVYACAADKHFGLASDDEAGRQAAVEIHRRANFKLQMINEFFGQQSVIAVQIATAPSIPVDGVTASKASLIKSLEELLSWDWQNARLVIEHCDTADIHGNFVKGFMSLDDEIAALGDFIDGGNVGITINWARSAIEGKNVETPLQHLKIAAENNILAGLMFSGASDTDRNYGVWQDNHMPFAQSFEIEHFEPNSLLTLDNISKCLQTIDPLELDYIGIKLLGMPIDKCSVTRRVGLNKDALLVLSNLLNTQI